MPLQVVRTQRTPFLLTLLITLFAATSHAQSNSGLDPDPGDPGTGGSNIIEGRVFFPSGRRFDKRLKVKLSSLRSGDLFMMTDNDGAFTFRRLAGGTYRITVDAGKEYELATETVDIIEPYVRSRARQHGQIYNLQIQLQPKQGDGSKPATINAAFAGVPQPALEYYKKAQEAAQAGESKKAIEHLQSALAVHPAFVLALNELGVQHLRLNQLDKATDALRAALKISPYAFAPRLNYGIVLLHKKQFAEAEAELRQAISRNNASATAHLYRGRALVHLGNYDEAEKELQRVISLGGAEVGTAHRYLGAAYIERGENTRAIGELEKYLSLTPKAKDADQVRQIIKQLRDQTAKTEK